jgi:hypothetical protein
VVRYSVASSDSKTLLTCCCRQRREDNTLGQIHRRRSLRSDRFRSTDWTDRLPGSCPPWLGRVADLGSFLLQQHAMAIHQHHREKSGEISQHACKPSAELCEMTRKSAADHLRMLPIHEIRRQSDILNIRRQAPPSLTVVNSNSLEPHCFCELQPQMAKPTYANHSNRTPLWQPGSRPLQRTPNRRTRAHQRRSLVKRNRLRKKHSSRRVRRHIVRKPTIVQEPSRLPQLTNPRVEIAVRLFA